MKNNEATVFVFIASIIIGVLISLNINLGRKSAMIILSAKQYQDAYNLKTKLHIDISDLKEQYNYFSTKLTKYTFSNRSNTEVLEEIDDEMIKNQMVIGTRDVHGPGLEIFLNDASTDFISNPEDYQAKLVHNTDVIQVINDLRNGGAEAIAINGQRITDRSEVYCDGPYLGINGVKLAAPFNISAIGNKEVLNSYMLDYESYLTYLMSPLRGINVALEEKDDIVIKAFEGEIGYSHMIDKK